MSPVPRPSLDPVLRLVDFDRVLERIDVNGLVERIDVNAILERVDLNALMERIDINALVARIDVEELVERTDVGSAIIDSTTSLGTRALDTVRSQGVGLDGFVQRIIGRVLRRDPHTLPIAPPRLVRNE